MKKIIISSRYNGKRIDAILTDMFRGMPKDALYKAFRQKDIKVNGVRIKQDYRAATGDITEIYIADDILEGTKFSGSGPEGSISSNPGFSIVYEDDNLIIVFKKRGIPVQSMETGSIEPLVSRLHRQFPHDADGFPALCHRIDKNTSGLVMAARNPQTLDAVAVRLKMRRIRKLYQCICCGRPVKTEATLKAYLEKDKDNSRVFIKEKKTPGSLSISTRYRIMASNTELSRLEIELLTGRTHQIRAHLAYIGYPILGDQKYGSSELNKKYGIKQQALCAYKIIFESGAQDLLRYLDGKSFEVSPDFGIRSITGITTLPSDVITK